MQAAQALGHGVQVVVATGHLVEVVRPVLHAQAAGGEAAVLLHIAHRDDGDVDLLPVDPAGAAQVAVDARGGLLAVGDGVDHHPLAPHRGVAAGEHAHPAGLTGETVHREAGGVVLLGGQAHGVQLLVDGGDHALTGDDKLVALHHAGAAAAVLASAAVALNV